MGVMIIITGARGAMRKMEENGGETDEARTLSLLAGAGQSWEKLDGDCDE